LSAFWGFCGLTVLALGKYATILMIIINTTNIRIKIRNTNLKATNPRIKKRINTERKKEIQQ
jgi:hypothetical protein